MNIPKLLIFDLFTALLHTSQQYPRNNHTNSYLCSLEIIGEVNHLVTKCCIIIMVKEEFRHYLKYNKDSRELLMNVLRIHVKEY